MLARAPGVCLGLSCFRPAFSTEIAFELSNNVDFRPSPPLPPAFQPSSEEMRGRHFAARGDAPSNAAFNRATGPSMPGSRHASQSRSCAAARRASRLSSARPGRASPDRAPAPRSRSRSRYPDERGSLGGSRRGQCWFYRYGRDCCRTRRQGRRSARSDRRRSSRPRPPRAVRRNPTLLFIRGMGRP